MKQKLRVLVGVLAVAVSASGCGSAGKKLARASGEQREVTLVHDAAADERMPKSYRTVKDPLRGKPGTKLPSVRGLRELRLSGSGQFSVVGLETILKRAEGPVTVFDLRQESHGFVAGVPVTWYAEHDWGNYGKDFKAAQIDEERRLQSLASSKEAELHDVAEVKGKKASPPLNVKVTDVRSEKQLFTPPLSNYVRLHVTDHLRPTDEQVDRFILAVRGLAPRSWVHLHCRGGKGRTTTFMVMYDMLRNARRVSFNDIVQRQALLGDDYDVMNFDTPKEWKQQHQKERAEFVRAFYDYAKANPDGKGLLWSEWVVARKL